MLSRRNVRIKVMQMLYALGRDNRLTFEELLARYRDKIDKSFELYMFCLLYLVRIAEYAQQDAARRKSKLLPTEEDLNFSAKLAENELLQSLVKHPFVARFAKMRKFDEKIDEDRVRQFYTEFAKSKVYKDYVYQPDTGHEAHQLMLLALFKFCIQSEAFEEILEDYYANWTDDKSLIIGAIKKTAKALPAADDFHEEYKPSEEATVEFGEELLRLAFHEDQELLGIIEPTLRNWDADRVAVIDMILIKMALCELMNFPTIPSKVTLNEFVEISKLYSTEKSKDFINGILDRLMKKLEKEGKIKKEGRGLLE
jgi:N utilization substance protein B